MFDKKGIIIIEKTDATDEDQLMDTALEAGMEDMKTYDDCFEIITTPEDFDIVKGSIVSAGYDIIEGDIEYVPSVEANPTDESDIKNLKKMLELMEDNDDVQKVYTNCSLDLTE